LSRVYELLCLLNDVCKVGKHDFGSAAAHDEADEERDGGKGRRGRRQGSVGRAVENVGVASVGAGWSESSCVLLSTVKGRVDVYEVAEVVDGMLRS
jgi:hypothetical protein